MDPKKINLFLHQLSHDEKRGYVTIIDQSSTCITVCDEDTARFIPYHIGPWTKE